MPFRHKSVYKSYVQFAMVAVGIEPVVWYAFRHYFASACAAVPYSIHDVAKWMGHANINVTYGTYMHLFAGTHDMAGLDTLSAAAPSLALPSIGLAAELWALSYACSRLDGMSVKA